MQGWEVRETRSQMMSKPLYRGRDGRDRNELLDVGAVEVGDADRTGLQDVNFRKLVT